MTPKNSVFHKFCAQWVPKLLTDEHNKKNGICCRFTYTEESEKFLKKIATGEEIWVSYVDMESQSNNSVVKPIAIKTSQM